MTWFKVDDKFHSHSKTRKVLAEAPAALALWAVAGSWSSDNLTDGFVPDHQLPWLIPTGSDDMARQLVTARFWKRVRGGYQFHEWSSDADGTRRNPTRQEVEAERQRKADAGRKGGLARAKNTNREAIEEKDSDFEQSLKEVIHNPQASATARRADVEQPTEHRVTSGNRSSTRLAPALAPAKAGASEVLDPPTRPDPTLIGGAVVDPLTPGARPPFPRCDRHKDRPADGPCGNCADRRRARDAWDQADTQRRRHEPQCQHHRGQPARNCGPCRSEALATEGTTT